MANTLNLSVHYNQEHDMIISLLEFNKLTHLTGQAI